MKVELIDEGAVLEGLQKVANRITLGLILAAMIVGAAMLMRVETSFGSWAIRVSRCCSSSAPRSAPHGWRSASCAATGTTRGARLRGSKNQAAIAHQHAASTAANAGDFFTRRVDRGMDAAGSQHLHALQADELAEALARNQPVFER